MRAVALVVAAGRGQRAGGGLPKQYRSLAGRPLLVHALRHLTHPRISGIRVVIHPDDIGLYTSATSGMPLLPPVAGGATRQASVRAGLEALAEDPPEIVLIHDAARAFLPAPMLDALFAALEAPSVDGAVPALPVVDSLRRGRHGRFTATLDRTDLWRVQTPQAFRFPAILAAHRATTSDATDDLAIALDAGLAVAITPGDERALKLTHAEDFDRVNPLVSRSASGFDVHAFGPGDHVWLCGIRIPHEAGLVGHSDADAGLHALTDALLGTIAAGDIGDHFPPSDPKWRGAASDQFLAHAAQLVRAAGGIIDFVDLTLICERPKIGPHRAAMRARIAEILAIDPAQVSLKATTTEQLGFTGRREGIAAQALASVRLPATGEMHGR